MGGSSIGWETCDDLLAIGVLRSFAAAAVVVLGSCHSGDLDLTALAVWR
jgi:hypothetical protein